MKVVFSASTSWYPYNFRLNTLKAFLKMGCKVYVVAPKDEYSSRYEGIGVSYIEVKIDRGGVNPISDLGSIISYFNIYTSVKPDYIFNFTPKCNIYSTIVGRIFTKNIINNMSGLGAGLSKKNLVYYCSLSLYYFSQNLARKVFFQNKSDLDFMVNKGIVKAEKCELIPGSGVDLERFQFSVKDSKQVTFIFSGRLLYPKGVGLFYEAARKLKREFGDKVNFSILGFVDEKAVNSVSKMVLADWVKSGNIDYLGATDDVVPYLRSASCIVLPSYYAEGVPKSLLEAAASGLPIITTDSVGCRETVEHNVNGFLCEPKSLDSLILCMRNFVNLSNDQRMAFGIRSREKVEKEFDETIVIQKYLRVINEGC
ncbi:glycosyltransferase family 4 protein [Shewanella baltica]|uniref:glycosyltransferase family 4 protein n=1 Tax=Shewanella baltica TaxID=62322 RepID=UPI0024B8AC43|nr:glycosyltransferase family 4 protein [Shewanella baltica]